MNADATPQASSNRATVFVAVTIGLDALALGLVLPVLPKLILSLGAGGLASTAVLLGAFAATFGAMQFLASPVQGALSDRFGRRPIMLASNLGLGLDYLVMALAPNLGWLFAGRVLSGVAAGSGAAAFAYIADVTPQDRRAASFGLLFAVQAVGTALGPALGGLLSQIDLRAPMWFAAALSLANLAYGRLVLPESLPAAQRAPIRWAQLNPLGAIAWVFQTYPSLGGLVAVAFLLSLASFGVNSIAVVYTLYRYSWGPAQAGLLLTAYGVASLAVQAGLVSAAAKAFGERRAMIGSLLLTVAGLLVFGAARTGFEFSLAVPFLALGAISGPMMASLFTSAVRAEEQGRLQAAWSSINSLMGLAAPVLFTGVFAASIRWGGGPAAGSAFFVAGAIVALAAVIAWARPRGT